MWRRSWSSIKILQKTREKKGQQGILTELEISEEFLMETAEMKRPLARGRGYSRAGGGKGDLKERGKKGYTSRQFPQSHKMGAGKKIGSAREILNFIRQETRRNDVMGWGIVPRKNPRQDSERKTSKKAPI